MKDSLPQSFGDVFLLLSFFCVGASLSGLPEPMTGTLHGITDAAAFPPKETLQRTEDNLVKLREQFLWQTRGVWLEVIVVHDRDRKLVSFTYLLEVSNPLL